MATKPLTKTQTAQLDVLKENGPICFWRQRSQQCDHLCDPRKYPKLKLTIVVLDSLVLRGLVLRRDSETIVVIYKRNRYLGTMEETYDTKIEFKVSPKGRK